MCAHSLSLEEPPKVIDLDDDDKMETSDNSDAKIAIKQEPTTDDDQTVITTAQRYSAGTSLLIDRTLTKKLSSIAKQKSKHWMKSTAFKAKIFRCELCDKLIFNSSGQAKHMKQHRVQDRVTAVSKSHLCRVCGESFATADSLKLHATTGRCVVIQCPECPQNFGTPDQLQHHLTTAHSGDDPPAGEEQLGGSCSNSGENVELLDVGDIKTEPCDVCECDCDSVVSYSQLNEPKYDRVIQKSAVQCFRCRLWLSSESALQHHTCIVLPDETC